MMKMILLALLLSPLVAVTQKQVYIPFEWQQSGGLDYSFDRSAESDNFIVFWGPLAGTDPETAPSEIAFNPDAILSTAEELYRFYIDTIGFIQDDSGLISQYKMILVMLHTWTGYEGWAFGGNYDGTVGAMWMHPHAASSGPILAHEFAHTLQNYTWMMNPGHGFIDSSYVGFFWETHAEFMALQKYPSVALEFDMARWLNTCQFHWSSTRHHYQAFVFLQYIKERDGITMINRLWNESVIGEHPLETYKRLSGIDQEQLNDLFGDYAMRNVTWDYDIGDLLRVRVATLEEKFVSHPVISPEAIDTLFDWYRIQNHLAPQDYGYNIIRLYPKQAPGCIKRWVQLHFQNQILVPGYEDAGWRYGFVAVDGNGNPRYSELYHDNVAITFELMDDEEQLYLVVTGAPKQHHNYRWEIGFPRTYRFPYEFRIENAWPEGFQPSYRDVSPTTPGAAHVNGGGFVANTAIVDASVYVGPDAQVLDFAQVRGNARIEGHAIIRENAVIREHAVITGQAIVGENAEVYGNAFVGEQAHVYGGCLIHDDARITGNTLLFFSNVYGDAQLKDNVFCWGAELHGDVILGGDAEFFRECSAGTYLQFEGAYGRNCDGLDDHPANEDLSQHLSFGWIYNNSAIVCDQLESNIFMPLFAEICDGDTFTFNGMALTVPGFYQAFYKTLDGRDSVVELYLDVAIHPEVMILDQTICAGDSIEIFGQFYSQEGQHQVEILFGPGCIYSTSFILHVDTVTVDTSLTLTGDTLLANHTDAFYQWYNCDTGLPVLGEHGRMFVPTESGFYQVEMTTAGGCVVFSECIYVSSVAIASIDEIGSWTLSPNPAHDRITMSIDQPLTGNEIIELIDVFGRKLTALTTARGDKYLTIDLQSYRPGLYYIRINMPGKYADLRRFVLQ